MLCDACRLPVLPSMVSVEIHFGSLVLGGGEIKVRPTGSPAAYVFCTPCGEAVAGYARRVVRAGGVARGQHSAPAVQRAAS